MLKYLCEALIVGFKIFAVDSVAENSCLLIIIQRWTSYLTFKAEFSQL